MPTMAEVRQKFPQYDDLSDADLASAVHKKFYSDMPEAEFNQKLGIGQPAPVRPPSQAGSWMDPFVGQGILMGAGDEMKAGVRAGARRMFGSSGKDLSSLYDEELGSTRNDLSGFQERHPALSPALELGGAVATAPFMPGGVAAKGASLGSRVLRGAATGAGYGTVYGGASADGDLADRAVGATTGLVTGAVTGAAAPAVIRGVQAAGRGVRDMVRRPVAVGRGVLARDREAARRIGMAQQIDDTLPQDNLSAADEAAARISGQPVLNIDRGGSTVRALADASATASPNARAVMEQAIGDRFAAQGDRTIEAVRRIVGGSTSAVNREALEKAAVAQNTPAYTKAFAHPSAQSVWDEGLETLAGAPVVQQAIRQAAVTGRNKASIGGAGPMVSPFQIDAATGGMALRPLPDGSRAVPTLEFWNQVKINLDSIGSQEARSAAKVLREHLDTLVPEYRTARAGAASFFGADDALTAGEEFVMSRMENDAARNALAKMKPAERTLFAEGFADALARRVAETGDRRNVINSVFLRTKGSKERIELALGADKAKELEAFLRIEDLLDRARGAISANSKTVQRLVELGIGTSATGYGAYTGDWKSTGTILGALLVRHGMGRVDRAVAQRVGEMLASPDPAVMQKGLKMVVNNDRWMAALRLADLPVAVGATQAAVKSDPMRVYLNAGERDRQMATP